MALDTMFENPAPSSNKLSSSEISQAFADLNTRLETIEAFALARYMPEPLLIYKPNERDNTKGAGLRLNFRATKEKGGAFLDLSGQRKETNERGHPTFNWTRDEEVGTPLELLTTKLGIPDIQALLLGYNAKRLNGKPTPVSVRSLVKNKETNKWAPEDVGDTVGLIHKNQTGTTIIEWKFTDQGSYLRLMKLPSLLKRSISLTLAEELSFVLYLSKALDAFLDIGVR